MVVVVVVVVVVGVNAMAPVSVIIIVGSLYTYIVRGLLLPIIPPFPGR